MTFTKILKNKDSSSEDKLTQLSELITDIRKSYGNKDVEIEVPYVNTVDGLTSLKYLDTDSKVILAGKCINSAIKEAVETCEETQGKLFDKEIESIIACSSILCNLNASTDSKYI